MENEKQLIDRNAIVTLMCRACNNECCEEPCPPGECFMYDTLTNAPTVDAVEVVHGHWKEYSHSALVRWKDGEPIWADRSVFRCSRCDFGTIARHNYCPRCGAKMDGGNEDG